MTDPKFKELLDSLDKQVAAKKAELERKKEPEVTTPGTKPEPQVELVTSAVEEKAGTEVKKDASEHHPFSNFVMFPLKEVKPEAPKKNAREVEQKETAKVQPKEPIKTPEVTRVVATIPDTPPHPAMAPNVVMTTVVEPKKDATMITAAELQQQGKKLAHRTIGEGLLVVPAYEPKTCVVAVENSVTLNMGDYNSAKVTVLLSVPCNIGEEDDAFIHARDFVDRHLAEEIKKVRPDAKEQK